MPKHSPSKSALPPRDAPEPHIRPPVIRPSLDGGDIYVTMNRDALFANPIFQISMRIVGVRRLDWRQFLLCRHWMVLIPGGAILGLSLMFGAPGWTPLLAVPAGLIYYIFMIQTHCSIASELRKRGIIHDLFLIPYLDPLEFGAGITLAVRYERRRIGSAYLAFIAIAQICAGLVLSPGQQLLHLFIGILILLITWLYAAPIASPAPKKRIIVTYREIMEALKPLRSSVASFISRSFLLWVATIAEVAACIGCIYWLNARGTQLLSVLASLVIYSAFAALIHVHGARAPQITEARQEIYALLRKSATWMGQSDA
ncbi:MAG: hypothetical protein NTX50_04365 [Candidatus Sumerlaeota bacterium]|nr:hypothetical protein [Candidatus Sumerlaeota bacterium]